MGIEDIFIGICLWGTTLLSGVGAAHVISHGVRGTNAPPSAIESPPAYATKGYSFPNHYRTNAVNSSLYQRKSEQKKNN